MQSRFIALPVGQGDGFFYQNDAGSVLIDGGKSMRAIASQLHGATSCSELDVLVCTHNDADHANGVLGILESEIQCREVWLPGRWTERLEDLLENPHDFSCELYHDWRETRDEYADAGTLDELGDRLSLEDRREDSETREWNTDWNNDAFLNALENATESNGPFFYEAYFYEFGPYPWSPYGPRGVKLLVDAVEAASRIRAIALAAFHAGAMIKWFEFGETSASPAHTLLSPLNCREILRTRRMPPGALRFLALSKANRESLVFTVQPTDELPGVVLSADSDFGFSFNLPDGDYLVTAPHHGSESNANAYSQLASVLERGKLVRSDGRYRSRPGISYLSLPPDRRYCTLCRGADSPKQTLEFHGTSAGWSPAANVRACKCN
ncbi:MAG: hypothetical protein WD049_08390 [Candidatus Paceibacterota bacterium]